MFQACKSEDLPTTGAKRRNFIRAFGRKGWMKNPSSGNSIPNSTRQTRSWRSRSSWCIAALAAGLMGAFFLSIVLGSVWVPLDQVIAVLIGGQTAGPEHVIIYDIRLPGSLTALLAGAALGIAGLQMQTLFRNPLADPFALGIAPGASLGVALVLLADGATVASVFGSSLSLAGDALVTAASIGGAAAALLS
jgi:iron complex transport system permease protein